METTSFQDLQMVDYFQQQPSYVKGSVNHSTEYNKRYLYELLYSVYEFTLPDDWSLGYFRYNLFRRGSIGVLYTTELGWIISPYSVTKMDYQYQPKVIQVTNTELPDTKTGILGVNAGILQLFDNYRSIDDLITDYATKLAQIDRSTNINLMNANVSKVFEARDKKQAEDIKEAYSKAMQGDPLVVINNKQYNGKDNALTNLLGSVKQDMIVDELLTAKRRITNEFLTKIGIRNANYEKKERLNSAEVEQNNDETNAIASVILANLQRGMDKINAISELGLAVSLRADVGKEESNDQIYPVRTLPV